MEGLAAVKALWGVLFNLAFIDQTGEMLAQRNGVLLRAQLLLGAEAIFAQWRTEGGRPVGFTPAGLADIQATYPETPGGGRFEMVAAVSAKREMNTDYFRKLGNLKVSG